MSKFIPFYDRLLVKQKEEQTKTAGGIIIPTTGQEKPLEGEVLAVGEGRLLQSGEIRPMITKVGDIISFPKHSYAEIKIDGENYLIIREENVLGKIV